MFKYIIFDFDGTLVDSKDIYLPLFNQLAKKYKFKKMEQEDFEYLRRLPVLDRCKFLDFPFYKLPFLSADLAKLYKDHLKNLKWIDGIKTLLKELQSRGYQLAIISSNSEDNIKKFLHIHQIDFIKEIFCSSNILGKDRVIKKFLKIHNLKNSEVIYVGDEKRDIVACKKTGVKVIWVGWGYGVIEMAKHEYPDFVVNKPEEILDIVHAK